MKVWLRYHDHAIPENHFTQKTGFAMPLTKVLVVENKVWAVWG